MDADTHTPLDHTELLDRFAGDAELLREIADTFLTHCPTLMAEIHDAVVARNAAQLRSAAHSLKGSVANFGAENAVAAAFRLERMGAEGELQDVDAAWMDLQHRLQLVQIELGHLIDKAAGH